MNLSWRSDFSPSAPESSNFTYLAELLRTQHPLRISSFSAMLIKLILSHDLEYKELTAKVQDAA